jgi:hypothetical protein
MVNALQHYVPRQVSDDLSPSLSLVDAGMRGAGIGDLAVYIGELPRGTRCSPPHAPRWDGRRRHVMVAALDQMCAALRSLATEDSHHTDEGLASSAPLRE